MVAAGPASKAGCTAVLPNIDPSLLKSIDVRVAEVLEASAIDVDVEVRRGDEVRIRKRKLLRIKVDIGLETREIVTDVPSLDAESAPGKKVLVIANVPPGMVHGHPSHGLLLLGSNYDPTPMPASLKTVLPTTGRLPAGATYTFV